MLTSGIQGMAGELCGNAATTYCLRDTRVLDDHDVVT